jgi:hypothetical protein
MGDRNRVAGCGQGISTSGQRRAMSSCEHGNKPSGSIKEGGYIWTT